MSFSRPATLPAIDTNSTNRSAPPVGKQDDGYALNNLLPSAEFNWALGFTHDWLAWLNERS